MSDRLKPILVADFLSTVVETTGQGYNQKTTVRGLPVQEADGKRFRQWQKGHNVPTIWSLDRWLTRYGLHLSDFFSWVDEDPWLDGSPWYERVAA